MTRMTKSAKTVWNAIHEFNMTSNPRRIQSCADIKKTTWDAGVKRLLEIGELIMTCDQEEIIEARCGKFSPRAKQAIYGA